jgi:hypothetical protein
MWYPVNVLTAKSSSLKVVLNMATCGAARTAGLIFSVAGLAFISGDFRPTQAQPRTAYSSWQNTKNPDVQYRWRSVSFGASVPTDCEVQYQYNGSGNRFSAKAMVQYVPDEGSGKAGVGVRNGSSPVYLDRGVPGDAPQDLSNCYQPLSVDFTDVNEQTKEWNPAMIVGDAILNAPTSVSATGSRFVTPCGSDDACSALPGSRCLASKCQFPSTKPSEIEYSVQYIGGLNRCDIRFRTANQGLPVNPIYVTARIDAGGFSPYGGAGSIVHPILEASNPEAAHVSLVPCSKIKSITITELSVGSDISLTGDWLDPNGALVLHYDDNSKVATTWGTPTRNLRITRTSISGERLENTSDARVARCLGWSPFMATLTTDGTVQLQYTNRGFDPNNCEAKLTQNFTIVLHKGR